MHLRFRRSVKLEKHAEVVVSLLVFGIETDSPPVSFLRFEFLSVIPECNSKETESCRIIFDIAGPPQITLGRLIVLTIDGENSQSHQRSRRAAVYFQRLLKRMFGIVDEPKLLSDAREAQEHVARWVSFAELPPHDQRAVLLAFFLKTVRLVE